MTESQGSVRLICSLSLASCRLKAEALVRLLHNKLWSLGVLSTDRIENSNRDCDKLIKENIFKTKPVHIIDKPPKSQIYGANDVNEHHWKHTMHTDEEEELYNTPNCSSPPSPAEEEILVNPPVYVSLPNVCALSNEHCSVLGSDPCSSQSLNNTSIEYSATFCKIGGITLKDKEILYEKLQKYANGNCPCIDEGVETFYDADSDNGEQYNSQQPREEEEIFVNGIFEKCTEFQSDDGSCSFQDNSPVDINSLGCSQTEEQIKIATVACVNENSFSDGKNEKEENNTVVQSSLTSINTVECTSESAKECYITVENYENGFLSLSQANEEHYETKSNVSTFGDKCNAEFVTEDPTTVECEELGVTSTVHQQNSGHQEIQPRNEPEEVKKKNCLELAENDDRPLLLRSTSLKTGKTPPGTPRRKKIVRFADALGLDLEAVRHIVMDDLPIVPPSAYSDLSIPENEKTVSGLETDRSKPDWVSATNAPTVSSQSSCQSHHTLCPLFQQPGADPDFLNRVRTQKVCLENVLVSDLMVHCIVRVLNIGYEKVVSGRYTINNWTTYDDVQASYVPGSCDGFSDKFSFNLFMPQLSDGQKLVFAVRYICSGQEYWDNNDGNNYSLLYNSKVSMLSSPEDGPSWLHHFI